MRFQRVTTALLIVASLWAAAPPIAPEAAATDMGNAARARHLTAARVPGQLSAAQRAGYRAMFDDLNAGNWPGVLGRLDEMPEGPLHDLVRARLYTDPGSPRVETGPLIALLRRAPYLPQAGDLARLARARGAESLPAIPAFQRLVGQRGQPRRLRPRAIRTEPLATTLDGLINPLIRQDQPEAAEALIGERGAELSPAVRAEFLQRVAWAYYLTGDDRNARRLGRDAAAIPGDWGIQGAWTAGLAAWRLEDCTGAATYFAAVARRSTDPEMIAAGHYWLSRAATACGRAREVQPALRAASALDETFYGLLAQTALGLRTAPGGGPSVLTQTEWANIARLPNVRAAIALAQIGQNVFADQILRHQARIGRAADHVALLHLAGQLNLPGAQMYLAYNAPAGVRLSRHDRYPAPDWRPAAGWSVDQALAYAHALQESNFRPEALSAAGARGLMQVRPGTASDLVRWGRASGDPARLNEPVNNLVFGQAYLRYLAEQSGTAGLLPRVIAAYNAGPAPIAAWTSARIRDDGDPLLWIESIPYWETRGYVPLILRNYWMYEAASADASPSRRALVDGLWPRFPGMSGPRSVRLNGRTQTASVPTRERAR